MKNLLAEERAVEERKKKLIAELLQQRDATMKDFDDRLAKLGRHPNGRPKRNRHKKASASASSAKPPKA